MVGILTCTMGMTSLSEDHLLAQPPKLRPDLPLTSQSTPSLQLLHSLRGHHSPIFGIRALAITPDGSTLVSGGREGKIILWNIKSGAKLREWSGHLEGVESITLSPDGQILVSGGIDREVKAWNLASGELLYTINGHSAPVGKVKFSPDGKTLATGSDDRTVKLWQPSTGRLLGTIGGLLGYPSDLVFTPEGRRLITSEKGTEKSIIRIWNLRNQKLLRSIPTPDSGMDRIALTKDGKYLVGIGFGQIFAPDRAMHTMKLWHLPTGKIVDEFPENVTSLSSLAVSRDGKMMICGTEKGNLQIWDLPRRKLLHRSDNYGQAIVSLVLSANRQILVGSLQDGTLQVWQLSNSLGDRH